MEAIPNPAVVDTQPLRGQTLAVREAFVERVLACGYVDRVLDALTDTDAISTIDDDNSAFAVGAGGFAGRTTASIAYTVVGSGPDAATAGDVEVLTNSLGYVFSQGSAFLLDADDPTSFDFPANYVVLLFDETPPIEESAALFETVGRHRSRALLHQHERLHAVRPGLPVAAVGRSRRAVHRRLRGRGRRVRRRVHADHRWHALPVRRRGSVSRQQLERRTPRVSRTWGASRSRATTSWRRSATPTCG